ncbi:hypothetical protein [Chryseobacterium tongliaoense]|uniref:hypothetical protein n=1 Tax=Chryseobacterium tongliaoense TaxID=3240933 RepID=UPI003516CBF4
MGSTYFFSAFGTFGNPNGFRQSFFLGGNAEIAKNIRTFDLKTDAIQLFPGSKLYGMRKEKIGGSQVISYSLYTFAKEQKSHRAGTFIGSSLMFIDKIAGESLVIDTLNEFHDDLEKKNVADETISINHSDYFSVSKPKDFDKIGMQLKEVDDFNAVQNNNNYLVVYSETNPPQLQSLFKKALDLLNVYEVIYFTQSHEVGEFVQQKGIFKIVDMNGFEGEISKLHEERTRILKNTIDEFEKEKQILKDEREKLIDEVKRQIEQNEKRHQENEKKIRESKDGIHIINQEYDQYSIKIDELIRDLKSDGKLETIKKLYNDNKKSFNSKINQNKSIESLNSVSSANWGNQGMSKAVSPFGNNPERFGRNDRSRREKEPKLNGYKIATFILSFLIIASGVVYFIFFDKGNLMGLLKEETSVVPESVIDTVAINPGPAETVPAVVEPGLNPFPISELNPHDRHLINMKIKREMKMDSLIDIIFKENPSSINEYYKYQKRDYAINLYNTNIRSFTIKDMDTILTDSLIVIPNYTKQMTTLP